MEFIQIGGAWAFLGLAAILALYMLKRRFEEHEVPSTYLWRRMLADQNANRPFQKLRKNLLMVLQLAVVALLALALMHPATKGLTGGDYVLIFDTSLSMRADGRMEQAKERALRMVDEMAAGSSVTVITAGNEVETPLSRSEDLVRVKQTISSVRAGYAGAALDRAVSLAQAMAREIDGLNIVVFSDDYEAPEGIRTVNAERGAENRAILSVKLARRAEANEAVVVVANYGEACDVTLEIEADGALWDVHTVSLEKEQTLGVPFTLPDDVQTVHARIRQSDALAEDNEAWGVPQDARSHVVAYAGDKNVFLETAIGLREDVELVKTDFEGLASAKAEMYVSVQNGLTVLSRTGATSITAGEEKLAANGSLVVSERETLMDGVSVDGVAVRSYRPLTGGRTLLSLNGDALISADDDSVVFGFDLHNTNFPLRLGFPVLMRNLLSEMLEETTLATDGLKAGDTLRFSAASESRAEAVDPDGVRMTLPCVLKKPGLYTLSQTAKDDVRETRFVVGLNAAELDVREAVPSANAGAGNAQRAAGRDYVRLLVCLALAVSMVEWWVSRRGY